MATTNVRLEGMGKLRRALLTVTEEGAKAASREIVRAGLNIQREAKRAAPVDTGRLRNSIAVAEHESDLQLSIEEGPARNQIRPGMLTAVVGTNVEYAPSVEFGTRRQRPQPYLLPAHEAESRQLLERLREQLGAAFVKASRG
jgi:HK97 gp10 family phage protein